MDTEQMQRDFKGVWISKEIWQDSRLNALDKIILVEIDSLDNEETGCFASNEYLAEFCQCGITKISTAITKLINIGYIERVGFDGKTRILKSRLSKNERQTFKNRKADWQKMKGSKVNNIINNKDDIKRSEKNARPDKQIYGQYKNVLLTQEEYDKIINQENGPEAIEFLSEYMEMKNYKVKSHYLAIKKWVFDAIKEKQQRQEKIHRFTVCDRPYNEEDKYKYSPFTKEQIEAMEAEGVFFDANYQTIINDPTGKYTEYLKEI